MEAGVEEDKTRLTRLTTLALSSGLWGRSVDKARAVLPDAGLVQIAKNYVENI